MTTGRIDHATTRDDAYEESFGRHMLHPIALGLTFELLITALVMATYLH